MARTFTPNQHEIIDGVAYIYMAHGHVAKVDAEDLPLVLGNKWYVVYRSAIDRTPIYVQAITKGKHYSMHRLILSHYHDLTGKTIDHEFKDVLDNRKAGLRIVTQRHNLLNRRGWTKGIPFKGVYQTSGGKYRVMIHHEGKQNYGGTFEDMTDAAHAADALSMQLRGSLLVPNSLNFPHRYAFLASGSTTDKYDQKYIDRFWSRIEVQDDGCWNFKTLNKSIGYGVLGIRSAYVYAHRISYELHKGPIPEGLEIDHLCRNRRCVNPDHLEATTARENTLRGIGASAKNAVKTHCPYGHPYDDANTITYYPKHQPKGMRVCKACRDRRNRAAYQKKKANIIEKD